ncbi:MAG: DUF47 family protein [Thermodesulfobacteriota bacterium]
MKLQILNRSTGIEKQIDTFLDQVSEAGLIFKQGTDAYLAGDMEEFDRKLAEISNTEHKGDTLKRAITEHLYAKTLIPESRGDVLELLGNMDTLLDRFKGALWRFDIERPTINEEFHADFQKVIFCSIEAVEAIVLAARAFFKNISAVADHLHKVYYWETECDKSATQLQRYIFRQEKMRLSHRMLLRDLVRHLDKVADRAEDAADQMNVYVIKRSL